MLSSSVKSSGEQIKDNVSSNSIEEKTTPIEAPTQSQSAEIKGTHSNRLESLLESARSLIHYLETDANLRDNRLAVLASFDEETLVDAIEQMKLEVCSKLNKAHASKEPFCFFEDSDSDSNDEGYILPLSDEDYPEEKVEQAQEPRKRQNSLSIPSPVSLSSRFFTSYPRMDEENPPPTFGRPHSPPPTQLFAQIPPTPRAPLEPLTPAIGPEEFPQPATPGGSSPG